MKTTISDLTPGITVIHVDPERTVLCDSCNEDYTDSASQGGIYGFGSKAICAICAPKWVDRARRYDELPEIKAYCVPGMSFADWVRDVLRTVNNG